MERKKNWTTDDEYKAFPQRLKILMGDRGITQQQLADYLQKTRQAVSYYCNGSSSPDWETLAKIATFFSVSTDYLVGIAEPQSQDPDIQVVCKYTGLSESSAEYLHARRASKTGFLTRLIDGILSETVIDEDVPFWVLQSAQAAALASVESDFAEDKCNIENKVAYLSRAEGSQYVISARDASDFYLRRAIEVATSKVSGVVMDMRDDVLADICQLQCDGAEFFRFIKLGDDEMGEAKNGND